MTHPVKITSEYNNRITNHQNHNPANIYWQTMNLPTFPLLPTAIPSQTQAIQMQLPLIHYTPPVQHQKKPSDINYTNNADRGQHIQKMTSSSEEEETQKNNNHKWQTIQSTKRKKVSNQPKITNDIETNNRYDLLTQQPGMSNDKITITPKIPRLPPIFVHGVQNYTEMIKRIQKIAEQEQYFTESLANNIVKINCETPETYKNGQRIQRTK
jgi:hypothetical protein